MRYRVKYVTSWNYKDPEKIEANTGTVEIEAENRLMAMVQAGKQYGRVLRCEAIEGE